MCCRNLAPEPVEVGSVSAGFVEIAVKAVGINFRDVLNVLGMYPGDPGPPGGDCAGVVVRAGKPLNGTPSLCVGQPVFGLAAGSLGSHVHASAQTGGRACSGALAPSPTSTSHAQFNCNPVPRSRAHARGPEL